MPKKTTQTRTTKIPHEYWGKLLGVGEKFECEPEHVWLLLTMGRIEPEPGEEGYVASVKDAAPPAAESTAIPPAVIPQVAASASQQRRRVTQHSKA